MAVAFPQKASWTERRKVGDTMGQWGCNFHTIPSFSSRQTCEDLWVL